MKKKIYHGDTEAPRERKKRKCCGLFVREYPSQKCRNTSLEEFPKKEEMGQPAIPLLPLFSSLKKRCGNFGHGIPVGEIPATLYFLLCGIFFSVSPRLRGKDFFPCPS
jgi:hypothetical protein